MKGCGRLIAFGIVGLIVLLVIAGIAGSGRSGTSSTGNTSAQAPASTATAAPAAAAKPTSTSAPAATATPAPTATPVALPKVGDTVSKGGWAIGLTDMKTASVLGQSQFSKGTKAQGIFVVLTVSAKNLQNQTSTLNTWDFTMKSPDGAKFNTSSEGSTELLFSNPDVKPLSLADQVQPGLTKAFALVFDVNPDVKHYTLSAASIDFAMDLP